MRRTLFGLSLFGLIGAAGCGCDDDAASTCELGVARINKTAAEDVTTIASTDDVAKSTPGIQVDVEVSAVNLSDGTEVTLSGGPEEATATVAGDSVIFLAYTVAAAGADEGPVQLSAQATGRTCATSSRSFIVGEGGGVTCSIAAPTGALNRASDGAPSSVNTIEVDVVVSTNAKDGASATLTVGGASAGGAVEVATAQATFGQVSIACPTDEAAVALEATVTVGEEAVTCSSVVTVNCGFSLCTITGFTPECPDVATLGATCSADEDQNDSLDGLQIDVCVASDAPDGSDVAVEVGSKELGTAEVTDGEACATVTLEEGPVALTATCEDAAGNDLQSGVFAAYIDTLQPDVVDDLSCVVQSSSPQTIACTFTVPADSGGSGADTYELCWDDATFDDEGFESLINCLGGATGTPGDTMTVSNIEVGADDCFYFGVKVRDEAGNLSMLSSDVPTVCVSSGCTIGVFTPPALATSLSENTLNSSHDGDVAAGMQATLTVATGVADGGTVELRTGSTVVGSATVASSNADVTTNLSGGLPQGLSVLIANCSDGAGNDIDSDPVAVFVDSTAPAGVSDLACNASDNRTAVITCTWTPPESGMATDLRYVRDGTMVFATATLPTPGVADGAITFDLANDSNDVIKLGSSYEIALQLTDSANNVGPVSNVATVDIGFERVQLTGAEVDDAFGQSIAGGDFNCDGFGDVAVGAPLNGGVGRVYLFFGEADDFDGVVDAQITGAVSGGQFGVFLAGLGDFDGDGCDDLGVAGLHDSTFEGRIRVYTGRASGDWLSDPGEAAEMEITGSAFDILGSPFAAVGDVNGDGLNDLAALWDLDHDEVEVYYGRDLSPSVSLAAPAGADIRYQQPDAGGSPWAYAFGWASISGGNLNGDAFSDVIVGAEEWGSGGVGGVFVLFGASDTIGVQDVISATDGTRSFQLTGFSSSVAFGVEAAAVGNIATGAAYLAVGDTSLAANTGEAYLFQGPFAAGAADASDIVDATISCVESPPAFYSLGGEIASAYSWACGGLCDLDGDSREDLVVRSRLAGSEPGGALVYFGRDSFGDQTSDTANMDVLAPSGLPAGSRFGLRIAFTPDVNGDGFVDLIINTQLPESVSGFGLAFVHH